MKYVIAVFNSHVDIESSLSLALSNVLSADVKVPDGPGGGTSGGSGGTSASPTVAALLQEATTAYAQAQTALKAGDLAGYQAAVEAMYKALLQAQAIANDGSSSGGSGASVSTPSSTTTTTKPPVAKSSTTTTTKTATSRKVGSALRPVSH